jgi:hypothetical protein
LKWQINEFFGGAISYLRPPCLHYCMVVSCPKKLFRLSGTYNYNKTKIKLFYFRGVYICNKTKIK